MEMDNYMTTLRIKARTAILKEKVGDIMIKIDELLSETNDAIVHNRGEIGKDIDEAEVEKFFESFKGICVKLNSTAAINNQEFFNEFKAK